MFLFCSIFCVLVLIDSLSLGGLGTDKVIMGFWGVAAGAKQQRSVLDYNSVSWSQPWFIMFLDDL